MPNIATKIPANVGQASANAAGNQGFTHPYYQFQYVEFGTPAARTSLPLGAAPCPCTCIGVSSHLGTAATTITYSPKKIANTTSATAVALTSTDAIIAVTTGPAATQTISWADQAAVTIHSQNGATTATGITDAVLSAVSGARTFNQGDLVCFTDSGTFTGGVNLAEVIWLREDNGTPNG